MGRCSEWPFFSLPCFNLREVCNLPRSASLADERGNNEAATRDAVDIAGFIVFFGGYWSRLDEMICN